MHRLKQNFFGQRKPLSLKLITAREKLARTDQRIVHILSHFNAASTFSPTPSTAYLSTYMYSCPLPPVIEDLSIDRNTPLELFAGVAQFLSLNTRRTKEKEFTSLCKELCNRHDHSRLIVEYKRENRENFKEEDNRVATFIEAQHLKVIKRAEQFAKRHPSPSPSHQILSRRVIEFCALAGAGWQDMAINDNEGPFTNPVSHKTIFDMRYPNYKPAS